MRSNCCAIGVIRPLARVCLVFSYVNAFTHFVKYESWGTVVTNFRQSLRDFLEPSKAIIYNLVKTFRITGSVLDKKRICVKRVLTKMLDEIRHRLERSPTTSSCPVAQQTKVGSHANSTSRKQRAK
ncbi:hypothetical protein ANN_14536 [Periplaneta americana]|uniref:Secreted protein n=1 Tax=Periplaneta americana TaxID=6978 RepID=A0ABQ8SXN6_PERAM|nr:hypothetical protein ANN_14536 [Periplaneta americana]